jgi:DNA-binding transcriptional MerR regulator
MIPNKSNFKFQELTPITGVKPYVIRFWETEFEDIDPIISDSGQKLYTRHDIEVILRIKKLLFDDKLSIQEAKVAIKSQNTQLAQYSNSEETPLIDTKVDIKASEKREEVSIQIREALGLIKEIKLKHRWAS